MLYCPEHIDHYPHHPELFTALSSFAGAVRTKKLTGVPFLVFNETAELYG